jgi:anti-sigma regulatory factor (Ser/Thr protein kinase)
MAVLTDLADNVSACSDGRRLVAEHLARWQVPAQVSGKAALLTSELIANAIQHGPPPLCLQISVDVDLVRVQMYDSEAVAPIVTRPDLNSVSGRGMWLIDTLAPDGASTNDHPAKKSGSRSVSRDIADPYTGGQSVAPPPPSTPLCDEYRPPTGTVSSPPWVFGQSGT